MVTLPHRRTCRGRDPSRPGELSLGRSHDSIALDRMEQRPLGRTGLRVSRLGLGTMTWGRDTDEHEARDQLLAFVEAGGTLVDTADVYGDGESEEVLGSLLGAVVAPRRTSSSPRRPARGRAPSARRRRLARAPARRPRRLAARLGIDHVDLWQLHAWDPLTPIEETLAALDTAVASGRARYVGVSNYAGWQTCAGRHRGSGPGPAGHRSSSTQVEYSLLQRGIEREVVARRLDARARHPPLVAARPRRADRQVPRRHPGRLPRRVAALRVVRRAVPRRPRRGASSTPCARPRTGSGVSPLEVALAWVRDRPGVAAPIVGARTAAQLRGALTVEDLDAPRGDPARSTRCRPRRGYPETAGSRR